MLGGMLEGWDGPAAVGSIVAIAGFGWMVATWIRRQCNARDDRIRAEGRERYDRLHGETQERFRALEAEVDGIDRKVEALADRTVSKEDFHRAVDKLGDMMDGHHRASTKAIGDLGQRIDRVIEQRSGGD